MRSDYHMHTSFSGDSLFPMEEEIQVAITNGLEEICFTEHVDHLLKRGLDADLKAYKAGFDRCKELYGDKITLKFGVEFGVQRHTTEYFKRDIEKYDFDFIIMSCHQVNDLEIWNKEFQHGKNQKEINEGYYDEIYQSMLIYKDYSVLGHLDAIKRDDPYGEYDDEKVMDIITKILKQAIVDGKGIEVNTSNFRYGLSDLTPSRKILKRYYDLGGKILTFGSDTHSKEHVGYKIEDVKKMVKEIGFTHFCTFEKMKPIFHEL